MDNAVLNLLLTARYVGGPAFAQMRGDLEGIVGATDGLSRLGHTFKAVGDAMVIGGLAMAAGVAEAVKQAVAYDDAINRIVAVMPNHLQGMADAAGAVDAHTESLIRGRTQLQAFRQELADAAVQWGQDPQKLAGGSYYLFSSLGALYGDKAGTTGVNDLLKNNLVSLLSQYSRASGNPDMGGVTFEQAAQDLPRLFTAYGMPMGQWGGGMGLLTYLENNAHLTQAQLVQSMTKFTPVGTALNMGFGDSALLMAALASSGVYGSRAGTEAGSGLYHMFGGTKSSMAGLSALGLDPNKLFDAQGNILPPELWLPNIAGQLAKMSPVQRLNTEHNLLGIVGGRGFGGLLNTGVDRYLDLYQGAKSAGVMGSNKQAEAYLQMVALGQMNSPKAQFESLAASVKLFGIAVGEAALPYVMQFVKWLRNAFVAATAFVNKLHDEGLTKFISDLQKTHPILAGIVLLIERIGRAIEGAFSHKGGGLGGFLGGLLNPQGGSGVGAALALGPMGLIGGGLLLHLLGAGMLFGGPHLFGGPTSPGSAALGFLGRGLGAGGGFLGRALGGMFGWGGGLAAQGLGGLGGLFGMGRLLPFTALALNTGHFGGFGADMLRHRGLLGGHLGGLFGAMDFGGTLTRAFPEFHKFNTLHDLGLLRGRENWAGALGRDVLNMGGGARDAVRGGLGALPGLARDGAGAVGRGGFAALDNLISFAKAPGYYLWKGSGAVGDAGRDIGGHLSKMPGMMKGAAGAALDLGKNGLGTVSKAANGLPALLANLGEGGFGMLKAGISGLLPMLAGLGSALLPIIAIALAVAGAVAIIILMFTRYRKEMQPVIEMLGGIFGPMFKDIGEMIKKTGDEIGKTWTKMAPQVDKAMKQFITALIQAKPVFEMIAGIIKVVVGIIIAIVGNLIKAFITVLPSIINVFTGVVHIITNVVQIIQAIFSGQWGKLPGLLKSLFGNILSTIGNAIGAILGFVGTFVTGFGDKLRDLTQNIPVVGGFVQGIGAALGGIGDFVGTALKNFRNLVEGALDLSSKIPGPWQDMSKKLLADMKAQDAEQERQQQAHDAKMQADNVINNAKQATITQQAMADRARTLKQEYDAVVSQANATTDATEKAALEKKARILASALSEAQGAQAAAKQEADGVLAQLISIEGRAAAAGEEISLGYANAILAHESQATANARAVAQAAAAAFNSVNIGGAGGSGHYNAEGRAGFASGGITPGGLVRVGESGWELAALPAGTHVFSHSESMNMLQNVQLGLGGGRGGQAGRISDLHVDTLHLPDGAFPQQQPQREAVAPEYQLIRQIQAQREANTSGYDRRSGFDPAYRYAAQYTR